MKRTKQTCETNFADINRKFCVYASPNVFSSAEKWAQKVLYLEIQPVYFYPTFLSGLCCPALLYAFDRKEISTSSFVFFKWTVKKLVPVLEHL